MVVLMNMAGLMRVLEYGVGMQRMEKMCLDFFG
jgi:hypothetical protein